MERSDPRTRQFCLFRCGDCWSFEPMPEGAEVTVELAPTVKIRHSPSYGQPLLYLPPGLYGQPMEIGILHGWVRVLERDGSGEA